VVEDRIEHVMVTVSRASSSSSSSDSDIECGGGILEAAELQDNYIINQKSFN
jgi:hypothetical protein